VRAGLMFEQVRKLKEETLKRFEMWAGVQELSLRRVQIVREKAKDEERRTHSLKIEEYRIEDRVT